jgi:stage III sporulation protein AB
VQESKAEEMKKKNEKMYRSLGVLSGLAIAIIFF